VPGSKPAEAKTSSNKRLTHPSPSHYDPNKPRIRPQRYADEQDWHTTCDDWIDVTLAASPPGQPAYDGVIARVGPGQLGLVAATAAAGVPLVNVHAGSPAVDELPGVFPDYEHAGRLRAEHLLSRGVRHFASWSLADRPTYERQTEAFVDAITAAGHDVARLDLPENWGETSPRYAKSLAKIHRWMDTWSLPIGVVSPTDTYARLVAQMAHERGWRVPEDVAIVGGMNEEKLCDSPRPMLTSVEMGFERIGYEAAKLLDALMAVGRAGQAALTAENQPAPGKAIHVTLPPVGVVVRESTDFYASGDDIVSQAQAFIAAQCHSHLEVTDVAAKVAVSVRTLQNRFAEAIKRTVAEEIRRVRLEKVKRELVGSDRPIHDIAVRAGFPSNARLADVFKREVGVTPRAYRDERKVRR
jgi:LacI family transcriptional regulator